MNFTGFYFDFCIATRLAYVLVCLFLYFFSRFLSTPHTIGIQMNGENVRQCIWHRTRSRRVAKAWNIMVLCATLAFKILSLNWINSTKSIKTISFVIKINWRMWVWCCVLHTLGDGWWCVCVWMRDEWCRVHAFDIVTSYYKSCHILLCRLHRWAEKNMQCRRSFRNNYRDA